VGRSVLILVDTHIVIWLAADPALLSARAKTAIGNARQNGEGLAISDMTLLELTMLSRRRIVLATSLERLLSKRRHDF
jgi:PIN domain nuclease of toxin-antitoxin system